MAHSNIFLMLSWIFTFCFSALEAHRIHTSFKETIPLSPQESINEIDCWRKDPNWASRRQSLAECARGFGHYAIGGKNGAIYVVNDTSDDPVDPKPGTLRYGAIQVEPLWITFERDMTIKLENELLMNSFKTIDGRGFKVEIANGPCITIEHVNNVIVHGISIHDCKPGKPGKVKCKPDHICLVRGADGDGISVFGSSNVWIDHCYLAKCYDGLVDIIHGSRNVTVSNNYLTNHNKVMVFGHQDGFAEDHDMKVTVAFNHFGPGLVQRMPRVRTGYAHVTNNYYEQWLMYAIGGSSNPTIFSEANYFVASDSPNTKEVTKRDTEEGYEIWKNWKWISTGDEFLNGAFFNQTGSGDVSPRYSASQLFTVSPASMVPSLIADAGPLNCVAGKAC